MEYEVIEVSRIKISNSPNPPTRKVVRHPKYGDIDVECVNLCDAMNLYPGIRTIESCCGHNENPFRLWFMADHLKDLPALIYWFAGCHCGFYNWKVQVTTDCGMSPVHFRIEGPQGEQGYKEADYIAGLLRRNALEESNGTRS